MEDEDRMSNYNKAIRIKEFNEAFAATIEERSHYKTYGSRDSHIAQEMAMRAQVEYEAFKSTGVPARKMGPGLIEQIKKGNIYTYGMNPMTPEECYQEIEEDNPNLMEDIIAMQSRIDGYREENIKSKQS